MIKNKLAYILPVLAATAFGSAAHASDSFTFVVNLNADLVNIGDYAGIGTDTNIKEYDNGVLVTSGKYYGATFNDALGKIGTKNSQLPFDLRVEYTAGAKPGQIYIDYGSVFKALTPTNNPQGLIFGTVASSAWNAVITPSQSLNFTKVGGQYTQETYGSYSGNSLPLVANAINVIDLIGTAGPNGTASVTYGVTLAPVPEPEQWAMLLLGLPLVARIASRKAAA